MTRYWFRGYQGTGQRDVGGVPVIDLVDAGVILPIWMREEPRESAESAEVEERLAATRQVWIRAFSRIVPDGERGFVSLSDPSVVEVTEPEFAAARIVGWDAFPEAWRP